jgi:succinate dehydrogenase / fumarate reductase flavoprotein subunit
MKYDISETIECDVLIVGVGGAGFRAAATILEENPQTRVVALTKVSHPQKSHTSTAQGGLAAVDPRDTADSPVYHMFDTWKGSDCMADQNVIQKIVEACWDEIIWLENRGMHFSRDVDGRLAKRTFGGHTRNFGEASVFRAVFESDRTGKGIMDTLWGETQKRGIRFLTQVMATELLFADGRCVGSMVYSQKDGKIIRIAARATILATGGLGQIFAVTTNCRQNTGDGLALVLRAGLSVMDPEAVQFHPTGIVGPGILASETLRSVGGLLRNAAGELFMEKYAPKMKELAPRDLVARAIETEIRQGRGALNPDHNIEHVWIDLRHLSDYVHEKMIPEVSSFFRHFVNIDPKKELCPIRPSCHYHMGGIPTNAHGEVLNAGQAVVPGLYAVGECAAASFHGFNRLGTNSVLELITMGRFVGERVNGFLKETNGQSPPAAGGEKTPELFARYAAASGSQKTGKLRDALKRTMTTDVGVFRSEKGIAGAIETLQEIHAAAARVPLKNKSLTMNQELWQRLELDNLLWASMVLAQSAGRRKESRGAHFRDDYPERVDAFNDHTLASMETFGEVIFGSRPVDMSIYNAGGPYSEKFGMIARTY